VTARDEIERIAAEHRAATDRIVERIDAIGRAAAARSARLSAQAREEPSPPNVSAGDDHSDVAPTQDTDEPEPPKSWLR
jgi:DNA-binding ferritin-like protein